MSYRKLIVGGALGLQVTAAAVVACDGSGNGSGHGADGFAGTAQAGFANSAAGDAGANASGASNLGGAAGQTPDLVGGSAAAGAQTIGSGGVAGADEGGDKDELAWLAWPAHPRAAAWDGTLPTDGICSVDRICWNDPLHSSNRKRTIWSSSPNDVWVGGEEAMLAHYDGSKWTGIIGIEPGVNVSVSWNTKQYSSFEFGMLHGTLGTSSNVWAVGSINYYDYQAPQAPQAFYRFDGTRWRKMTSSPRRATAIWATGEDEVWATEAGGVVAHWDGSQWSETTSGGALRGIYGFSNTDIWVAGDQVRHFDGNAWKNMGGAGPTIWGPASGDMWTGDGAHLVAGKWVPLAGVKTPLMNAIGVSDTNLLFLGAGAGSKDYYQQGQVLAASSFPVGSDGPQDEYDTGTVWPVAANDYWVASTSLSHGDPAAGPGATFTASGPSFEAETPRYIATSKCGLNGNFMPTCGPGAVFDNTTQPPVLLRQFDAPFYYYSPDYLGYDERFPLAWNDHTLWVCNAGQLYRYQGGAWSTVLDGPSCWSAILQTDGEDRLWLATPANMAQRLWVYDGAWHPMPWPSTEHAYYVTLKVRGHEAWIGGVNFEQPTAYRFNGHGWDDYGPYGLGICITADDQVYFGWPGLLNAKEYQTAACPTQLILKR